jgi:hypothetical protein
MKTTLDVPDELLIEAKKNGVDLSSREAMHEWLEKNG